MYRYVETLNRNDKEFVFAEIGDAIYFQFGGLSADAARLNASILAGSYIGFFQGEARIRDLRVVGDWGVNGIPVEEVPDELTLGETYTVKSTQAQPGSPGDTTGISVDQGIVRFSKGVSGQIGIPMQFSLDYRVVDKQYIAFAPRFYASPADFDTDRPIPEDDPKYPENVIIDPPLPFLTPGFYVHDIQLTPTYSGALLISVDLLEATEESEPDPVRPTAGLLAVDANDNAVVDRHGNFVIENSNKTYNYETDVNGNFEVDVHGDRVLEIVANG